MRLKKHLLLDSRLNDLDVLLLDVVNATAKGDFVTVAIKVREFSKKHGPSFKADFLKKVDKLKKTRAIDKMKQDIESGK